MGNRPRKGYDYSRAGVAMITLKTCPGIRLCRITQDTFEVSETGRIVQQALKGITTFHEQVKIGQYQIMPDHLHALVHVVSDLPEGMTLPLVIRGFKIGVNRACREQFGKESCHIFEKGMHHSLVFDRAHLKREVEYIRDNVRRYRLLKAHPELFRAPRKVMPLPDGTALWGFGNAFLLEHPRRVQVQFSRRATEADWEQAQEDDGEDMRLIHIVAGLQPGSGIAMVVSHLCARLAALGHEVVIVTLGGPLEDAALEAQAAGVRIVQMRPAWPHFLYFSWQMLRQLPALCRNADVVHVHSNWTFPVWWGCRCALKSGKPLVMSPHGCLDPVRLRHAWFKKRLVGWIDRALLRRAAAVHATSEMERGWVVRFLRPPSGRKEEGKRGEGKRGGEPQVGGGGNEEGKRVVVPNGVSLRPLSGRKREGKRGGEPKEEGGRMVLYLGRLHPLKGLDMLVEAWGNLHKAQHQSPQPSMEHWRLVIAGPDEQGTRAALERQARELGLMESITFAGPVYGGEKERLLDTADLFVLPSRSENFGLVVAEALGAGVPVIATRAAPWRELLGYCDHPVDAMGSVKADTERALDAHRTCNGVSRGESPAAQDFNLNFVTTGWSQKEVAITSVKQGASRCGWWVEVGVGPLAEALREAMGLTDEERWAMGQNGRRLVERKYRWEAVAEQMVELYTHIQACTA